MMKSTFLFILFIFNAAMLYPQDSALVAYSYSYNFKNGIYLRFDQFKENRPVAVESIVENFENEKYDDVFDYIDNSKSLKYYNEYGILTEIESKNIWGYCRNGKPYVNWNNGFRQIGFIGSVCHFVATVLVYQDLRQAPYYDPYSYNYYGPDHSYTSELFQLIIDMQTGEILFFDSDNVASVIKSDKALFDEFSDLNKRKKRKMLFYYIRKFNEKHPLYLPSN